MIVNDEMLSAYMDNELSAQERALVDARLRDDASVADRLTQLASVNALVGRQAALIDQLPMPDSVLALLRTDNVHPAGVSASRSQADPAQSNVVELSRFRRAQQRVMHTVREHAALAASLALLVGFAGGQLLPGSDSNQSNGGASAGYFAALETLPSGQPLSIDANTSLTARFSFVDTQSRFCRQYLVQGSEGSSENLACRDQDEWIVVASAHSSAIAGAGQYQTASGPLVLDNILDAMMQGAALSQAEEQAAINNQWQAE